MRRCFCSLSLYRINLVIGLDAEHSDGVVDDFLAELLDAERDI